MVIKESLASALSRRDLDDITGELQRVSEGDAAFDDLLPLVYRHLRQIAQLQLKKHRRGLTFETCALVHETYLKMLAQNPQSWRDRGHFFAITALAMRQVLVDQARRRQAAKRGGESAKAGLDEINEGEMAMGPSQSADILALDQALDELDEIDPRMRQVVEMRYFAGLDENEIAEALEVNTRTVQRLWKRAKIWLRDKLQ